MCVMLMNNWEGERNVNHVLVSTGVITKERSFPIKCLCCSNDCSLLLIYLISHTRFL